MKRQDGDYMKDEIRDTKETYDIRGEKITVSAKARYNIETGDTLSEHGRRTIQDFLHE